MKYISIFFIFLVILSKGEAKYPHEISIMAVFQNEGPYLKEWIDYHLLLGVDHFYLYNHNSTDSFMEVLVPYIEKGIVDYVDYSCPGFPQREAFVLALARVKNQTKWLALIDVDEYILPLKHDNLKEFLSEYEAYGGVSINWQCFGTSHVSSIPPGEFMIEHLTFKALPEFRMNTCVKCIVRPERIKEVVSLHSFRCVSPYFIVRPNKSKQPLSATSPAQTDTIVLNHYWTKDEDFFYKTKVPRCKNRGWSMETIELIKNAMDAYEDRTIINKYINRMKFMRSANDQKSFSQ